MLPIYVILTEWNFAFFYPLVKMEIHVRKLGVREVERRQALFWALVFLVIFWSRETKAKKKYSDLRERKTSFGLNNC